MFYSGSLLLPHWRRWCSSDVFGLDSGTRAEGHDARCFVKEAEKIKNTEIQYKEAEENAIEVYSKEYCNWKKPDFQLAIHYKEGPVPDKKIDINQKIKARTQGNLQGEVYWKAAWPFEKFEWTEEEEANLHAL